MHSEGEGGNSKGGGEERQQRRNHQHRQKGTHTLHPEGTPFTAIPMPTQKNNTHCTYRRHKISTCPGKNFCGGILNDAVRHPVCIPMPNR